MLPPSFHRGEAPSPPGRTAAPYRPASSANRLAPPCARRTGAAAGYRFGAPPPTRPRRAHRIPPPFVPWPRHSSDADAPPQLGDRPCRVPQTFRLYGQPYMRPHISNVVHIVPVKSRVTRWGRRTAYDAALAATGQPRLRMSLMTFNKDYQPGFQSRIRT